ncbi:MAG: hypothetical protein R3Y58_03480 [Eubacteriales bacterium]
MSYYYMTVTPDEYELPIAVAESVTELSEILGISCNSISTALSRGLSGKKWGFKIIKIEKREE